MCPWGADFLPLHATPKVVMLAGWALELRQPAGGGGGGFRPAGQPATQPATKPATQPATIALYMHVCLKISR